MKYDIVIRNARLIDPCREIDHVEDLYIYNSKIVAPPLTKEIEADEIIDAKGYIVVPGLIDFHVHINYRNSDFGFNPDIYMLPNCITAAVDAGSAGTSNFEGMVFNARSSVVTVKSFINPTAIGIQAEHQNEDFNHEIWDIKKLEYLFERYREDILGLKIRIGERSSGVLRYKPLEATVALAEKFNCPVCVHIVNPLDSLDTAVNCLREGDILCHCYQALGPHTIFDEGGKIRQTVQAARKRGVVFDCATGFRNQNFELARKAIQQCFYPDIISSDLILVGTYRKSSFSLLRIMAEYLALGMTLPEVIKACTQVPAQLMGLKGTIGTLQPGAWADVAILKEVEKPVVFEDLTGGSISGNRLLVPQITIKAGKVVYEQMEFSF